MKYPSYWSSGRTHARSHNEEPRREAAAARSAALDDTRGTNPLAPSQQLYPGKSAGDETPPFPGQPLVHMPERAANVPVAMLEALRRRRCPPCRSNATRRQGYES